MQCPPSPLRRAPPLCVFHPLTKIGRDDFCRKDKATQLEAAAEKREEALKRKLTAEHEREREILELQAHRAGTALSSETAGRCATQRPG
eukprot:1821655-Rhodomonas_salina.2